MSPPARLSATRHFLSHLRELRIGHLHLFVNPAAYPLLFTALSPGAPGSVPWCAANTLCQPTARSARHIDAVYQPGQDRVGSFTGNQSWYDVSIRAARRPVYLVFQQAYDPNWIAFVLRGRQQPSRWTTLLDRPLPQTAHLVANGYANTWLIRQTGTYHVVLEYWPQRLVLLGWFIALVALLACTIFFLVRVVDQRRKPLFWYALHVRRCIQIGETYERIRRAQAGR
jgi:hypothetical protein